MIYTVTFNPSLDYYVQVNNFKSGIVNRVSNERLAVGGKGINVSLALKELQEETFALGFVAGFTGEAIKKKVASLGLNALFFDAEGQSRINVKIKGNTETDINGTGAHVSQTDINALIRKLKAMLKEGDWVVISGSVPSNLDEFHQKNQNGSRREYRRRRLRKTADRNVKIQAVFNKAESLRAERNFLSPHRSRHRTDFRLRIQIAESRRKKRNSFYGQFGRGDGYGNVAVYVRPRGARSACQLRRGGRQYDSRFHPRIP